MKIGGKSPSKPKPIECYIPREDDVIRFICQPVVDYSKFDALCPDPIPPTVHHKDGRVIPDFDDVVFKEQVNKQSKLRHAYLILESLAATPDLEWETVQLNNPDTWLAWDEELRTSGFNNSEINRVIQSVFDANSLNPSKFEEAKERFIRSQSGQV